MSLSKNSGILDAIEFVENGSPTMQRSLNRLFNDHPASVDETYLQHMAFAGQFSGKLFLAGFAAAVHAVLPFLFEKTASRLINEMHHRMHNRSK